MADVRAFPALAYDMARVGDLGAVVAPPYDVIPTEHLPELRARSSHNVVHLTRPGDDYQGAAALLETWKAEGVLRSERPAMYLHEVEFDGRRRRDLIAALRLQPYEDGVVLPHERTHRGPKEDRLALLQATRTSLEPLWFLYEGKGRTLPGLLERGFDGRSAAEFEFDGTYHRLWRLEDAGWQDQVREALAALPVLIADGHHRYETALAFADEQGGDADAASRFTLALLTDLADPGLQVLATHRLLIENILGKRSLEENVEYTRDPEEAVRWVDEGRGVAAFFLGPPDLAAVLEAARAGTTMPQKTTYFHPKPPSGMLFL